MQPTKNANASAGASAPTPAPLLRAAAYPHYAEHCARIKQRALLCAAFEVVFDAMASHEGVTPSFDELDESSLEWEAQAWGENIA